MKIYFNHIDPNRFHSVYRELIDNPPIDYVLKKKQKNKKTKLAFSLGKKIVNFLCVPTINFVDEKKTYLIHSAQSLPISNTPFVVDFEHISAFAGWNLKRLNSPLFKFFLKLILESNRCKKILPWTHAAAKSLTNLINSKKIENKIEVVYPAIKIPRNIVKRRNKKLTILFVAYNFKRKGGEELLNAFFLLKKKIKNVRLLVVSEIKTSFEKYPKNEDALFLGLKTKKELYEDVFSSADLFVYPSYHDTFGMVYLEAMAFGLPIITLDDFPTAEIIENKKEGVIIKGYKNKWYDEKFQTKKEVPTWKEAYYLRTESEKMEVAKKLYEKMLLLAKNKKLREQMGRNGYNKILKGKFSIEHRNKQLRRIYAEAIASKN